MKILTQNRKMKKASKLVYNFGIPAFRSVTGLKTCPEAGKCVVGCYAKSGTFLYPNVKNAYEQRLALTQHENFIGIMTAEIQKLSLMNDELFIRIHDSGDFYSEEYALKWFKIIEANKGVKFYAYTKMVQMFKRLKLLGLVPENLTLIFSYGGRQDSMIDANVDRHAKVFEGNVPSDYADGTHDDMVASCGASNKIGLVYHGAKKFSNTQWGDIA